LKKLLYHSSLFVLDFFLHSIKDHGVWCVFLDLNVILTLLKVLVLVHNIVVEPEQCLVPLEITLHLYRFSGKLLLRFSDGFLESVDLIRSLSLNHKLGFFLRKSPFYRLGQ